MGHEAHVRFVDTHAESDSGDDNDPFLPQEALLVPVAHTRLKPRVVGQGRAALCCEPVGNSLGFFAGQAIDNSGVSLVFRFQEVE